MKSKRFSVSSSKRMQMGQRRQSCPFTDQQVTVFYAVWCEFCIVKVIYLYYCNFFINQIDDLQSLILIKSNYEDIYLLIKSKVFQTLVK